MAEMLGITIQFRVSAVLLVRDGFTGRAVARNDVRIKLDGQYVRPEYKTGGYFVFVDLEPGPHEAVLEGIKFRTETVHIYAPESGYDERNVALKPSQYYPFGVSVTRLKLVVCEKKRPMAGAGVIIAVRSPFEPKIAQDVARSGDTGAKLYIRGDPEGLRLPAECLIVDGKESEVCVLTSVLDTVGTFRGPLAFEHKRGKALFPCQTYTADDRGEIAACFREPAHIEVFIDSKRHLEGMALSEGENELVIEL